MTVYAVTFAGVAMSLAQDIFEIVAPSNSWVRLRQIRIGQFTDFGDAQAEIISIAVMRGFTTAGSGGSTPTVTKVDPRDSQTFTGTVLANNTTVATNGTTNTPCADVMNVAAGWWYDPEEIEMIMIAPGERCVIRTTAPVDAFTANGTVVFETLRTVQP